MPVEPSTSSAPRRAVSPWSLRGQITSSWDFAFSASPPAQPLTHFFVFKLAPFGPGNHREVIPGTELHLVQVPRSSLCERKRIPCWNAACKSGEVERTRMLHLERVVTCVSRASKDKNAPQRFAGEDNSQILTETQQEFKMDLPTDHEITDVTENTGNMWKSLQECGNTELHDAFNATQEGTRKSGVLGTRLEYSKIGKESVEFSAEVADMWSATMDDMNITSTTCDDVDENFDIDDENWDHHWNTVNVVADEILPAIVPERDKECDVTASEQTRKKTTWLMLARDMLRVLEESAGLLRLFFLSIFVVSRHTRCALMWITYLKP